MMASLKKHKLLIGGASLVFTFILIGVLTVYKRLLPIQRIVTVDMAQIMRYRSSQFLKGEESQLEKNVEIVKQQLVKDLETIAQTKNLIIIPKTQVIGARDITSLLILMDKK